MKQIWIGTTLALLLSTLITVEAAKPTTEVTATPYREVPSSIGPTRRQLINSAVTEEFICTKVGSIEVRIIARVNTVDFYTTNNFIPPVGTPEEYCAAWIDYWIIGENIPPFPAL